MEMLGGWKTPHFWFTAMHSGCLLTFFLVARLSAIFRLSCAFIDWKLYAFHVFFRMNRNSSSNGKVDLNSDDMNVLYSKFLLIALPSLRGCLFCVVNSWLLCLVVRVFSICRRVHCTQQRYAPSLALWFSSFLCFIIFVIEIKRNFPIKKSVTILIW